MDYEIVPEPTPAEREALLAALARLLRDDGRGPAAYRSRWRLAGLPAEGDDQAAARPRRRRGASRA